MTRWFAPLVLGAALLGVAASAALAEPPGASPGASPVKEATKHFHRGVALYSEADYRGALTEFKRAYEIAPNASVLYNVGETYYQLQNYAAALAVFERYLTEAGANAPHRREVEQTLEILRTRVGSVQITTNVPGCEITVDDDLVGKTPFDAPVVVSVGRRKITALHTGRAPETRFVEVSAGDTTEVALSLTPLGSGAARPAVTAPDETGGVDLVKVGWGTTGALAAGTLATGIWAYVASRQLQDARHTFPTTGAELDSKASRARTLGIVADVMGAATVVAGAITLKLTLSRSQSHEVHVAVVPGGIQVAGAFR
jgi:tetratricopeptide (TPR) repeat protein